MSLVNHKSPKFSFNRTKHGINAKHKVHILLTLQFRLYSIYNLQSINSIRKLLHEVLSAWLLLCFEPQVNKSTNQLQRTTIRNPDSRLTSLFFTLLLRCICQHSGSALLETELLWHPSHGFLTIIHDRAMWSLTRNLKQRNKSNFWP